MQKPEERKIIKRLSATLPDPLANFVSEITGDGGLYETPSEFVRDLIRRYMESLQHVEYGEINQLIVQSISENNYESWTEQDVQDMKQAVKG